MTDLAVAQTVQRSDAAPQQVAQLIADWVQRLSALGGAKRSECPAAWELTGITRIDRYDTAPWLSF
jgi:hypothetical protein